MLDSGAKARYDLQAGLEEDAVSVRHTVSWSRRAVGRAQRKGGGGAFDPLAEVPCSAAGEPQASVPSPHGARGLAPLGAAGRGYGQGLMLADVTGAPLLFLSSKTAGGGGT